MKYLPPLDGIRAIAILAVLVFHFESTWLPGGYLGVDVFFVLSGFLITSIILADRDQGTFSFREFYLRRIQRLLPNAMLMIAAVLAATVVFKYPTLWEATSRHSLWALLNLSNIYIWREFGWYWGQQAEAAPLTHTWSLAVEEQFYLLFPVSLILVARFWRRSVSPALIAATLGSYALWTALAPQHPSAAFYLLPTRAWELLTGASLAALGVRAPETASRWIPGLRSKGVMEAAAWFGLLTLAISYGVMRQYVDPYGPGAILPAAGTALVLLTVGTETTVSRLLSLPWMVRIGRVSYSLYLWHWPAITFGRELAPLYGRTIREGTALGMAAGISLGLLAYAAVEQPMRSRGAGRRSRLIGVAGAFSAIVLVAATLPHVPVQIDLARDFDPPTFRGGMFDAGEVTEPPTRRVSNYDVVFETSMHGKLYPAGGILHLNGGESPQVVVVGSSHALMYSGVIDDVCNELGVPVAYLGVGGVRTLFQDDQETARMTPEELKLFDRARIQWIQKWQPKILFIIDRWEVRYSSEADFSAALRAFLRQVSGSVETVYFVAQVPVAGGTEDLLNLRELLTWRRDRAQDLRLWPSAWESRRKGTIRVAEKLGPEFPNLRVLRPDIPFLQPDGSVRLNDGRAFYYLDNDHLAEAGAQLVRRVFEDAIGEAAGSTSGGHATDAVRP